MAGDSQSTMKSVNPHPMKIDVVKFDDTNNFGCGDVRWWMHWCHQTLKTLYDWEKNRRRPLKRIGTSWIWRLWTYKVLFNTRHQVSCVVWDCRKEAVGDPRKKYLTKIIKLRLQLKRSFTASSWREDSPLTNTWITTPSFLRTHETNN